MKKNSLLSAALLLALVSVASAAQTSEPLPLPTYVVETSRNSDAEQSIGLSLTALRDQARMPVRIAVELPALRAQVVHVTKSLPLTRLAKS
jgi:hypothetical protein